VNLGLRHEPPTRPAPGGARPGRCQWPRARSSAALQRLRVERLALVPGRLGHLHVHGAGWRVDPPGLGAVCVAPALGRALVMPGPEKALALASRIASSKARANTEAISPGPMLDQLFQERLNRRILPSVHLIVSVVVFATPWNTRMGSPGRGSWHPPRANFQTSGYSTRTSLLLAGASCM